MSLLAAENLVCVRSDRQLFGPLHFSLQEGELMHLTGPNGAGKTSLLRILTGLAVPSEGQVYFRGTRLAQASDFLPELNYIGHKPAVNGRLSAIENLRYWLKSQAMSCSFDLYELLDNLGLVGLEDIPAGQLSAGQQRRVALARLWLKPSLLWILDEPFTALDSQAVIKLQRHFEAHVQQGGAVLLTSHQALDVSIEVKEYNLEYRW